LRCIADAPSNEQIRCELRDIFNRKLSSDPSVSLHRSTLTNVELPTTYLRHMDWAKLMNNQEDVNNKLIHLAKFWANLGLQHPTEACKRTLLLVQCSQSKRL
jgi:hypothetical protein